MTEAADRDALSDAVSLTRDYIEAMAALNTPSVDAITEAITAAEDIQGKLWLAECRADELGGIEAQRELARDVAWHNGRV